MNEDGYHVNDQYTDLPDHLSVVVKCLRDTTGSVVHLVLPRHVTPHTLGEYVEGELAWNFIPMDIFLLTQEGIDELNEI